MELIAYSAVVKAEDDMGQWWKRYEHILEAKPQPVVRALLSEMGKSMCEVCAAFPPPLHLVSFTNQAAERRFAPRLADMPVPDLSFVEALAKILRHELRHELDELENFLASDAYKRLCPTENHREAMLFLWPVMLEMLFSWKDQLKTGLKKQELLEAVAKFEEHFRRRKMLLM